MTISDDNDLKATVAMNMPSGVEAQNIFYFKTDFQEPQTEEDIVDACAAWVEGLYQTIDTEMSNLLTMGVMQVYQYLTITDEWLKIGEATPDVTFTNIQEMLPHGVAGLVRGYTTRSKTIGRKYLPGFTEEDNEDGEWVAGLITSLGNFAINWGATEELDANNRLNPGVFSTTQHLVFEFTDEFVVLADPAYQRRRRPGVGS